MTELASRGLRRAPGARRNPLRRKEPTVHAIALQEAALHDRRIEVVRLEGAVQDCWAEDDPAPAGHAGECNARCGRAGRRGL